METNSGNSKSKFVEALREGMRGNKRSKKAMLLEIFDEVEAAKAAGLSHKTIVEILEKQGLIFTQGTFEVTRQRILKKRREEKPQAEQKTTRAELVVASTRENIPKTSTEEKPAGMTEAAWNEVKAKIRSEARRAKT